MPLIKVMTSLPKIDNQDELLKKLSLALSTSTGKPENYVMTILQCNVPMTFAGSNEPSCFIEVKSIGSLKPSLMTSIFCEIINNLTNIPSSRVYISFEDIDSKNWGFNNKTFG